MGKDDALHQIQYYQKKSNQSKRNLFIVEEIDGTRIFSDEGVEFLQVVSEDLKQAVYTISTESSKMLLEAYVVKLSNSMPSKKSQNVMRKLGQ